jgi:hypothetical protein
MDSDYNEAIRLMPSMAEGFEGRSRVHRLRNELEVARTDHKEAVRLGLKNTDVPADMSATVGRNQAPVASEEQHLNILRSERHKQMINLDEAEAFLGGSYREKRRCTHYGTL